MSNMSPEEMSNAIARLFCALDEAKKLITHEILPLAELTGCSAIDPELVQTLDLAQRSIADHFKMFRIQVVEVQPGKGGDDAAR